MTVYSGFPGATAVSRLRVYDWPAPDGLRGGSPHMHTASTEGYIVHRGTGVLQTLSGDGYREYPLSPGTVLWFTPGTIHRVTTATPAAPIGEDLEILVVMQNAGLPEAGDAVFTFPPSVLSSPDDYAAAAALESPLDTAARRRRDLAVTGFLALRDGGPSALTAFYEAAARIVQPRVAEWQRLWEERAQSAAQATGDQLADLSRGAYDHLSASSVSEAEPLEPRFGMCGHLNTYAFAAHS
jgi:mannose-6-phosphate isomerase-like protein (cupin superfamily)